MTQITQENSLLDNNVNRNYSRLFNDYRYVDVNLNGNQFALSEYGDNGMSSGESCQSRQRPALRS